MLLTAEDSHIHYPCFDQQGNVFSFINYGTTKIAALHGKASLCYRKMAQ
jgi:hypothetical protein